MDDVGFTANETFISCPVDIPPRIPPALFDLKLVLPLLFKISSTSLGLQIYLLDPFTYTDCVFKKVNNSYETQA